VKKIRTRTGAPLVVLPDCWTSIHTKRARDSISVLVRELDRRRLHDAPAQPNAISRHMTSNRKRMVTRHAPAILRSDEAAILRGITAFRVADYSSDAVVAEGLRCHSLAGCHSVST